MTIPEFLKRFEKVAPRYKWEVCLYSDCVRGRKRAGGLSVCPIEAVAGMLGACYVAGPALRMSKRSVRAVAFSADQRSYNPRLRRRLLRICGLKERA